MVNGEVEAYIHIVHDKVKYYEETSKKIQEYIHGLEE